MIVKKQIELLKKLPNTINLSKSVLNTYKINNGPRKIFVILKLIESRINHFTKDSIIKLVSDLKKREKIYIVNIEKYLLPTTYNIKTNSFIINLLPIGSDDLLRIDSKNIYAALVNSVCFGELVSKKYIVNQRYSSHISNFILSLLIRLFGKQYGLLGGFSKKIIKLKFMTNVYILNSFFGIHSDKLYNLSAISSSFDYNSIKSELDKYDFSNINDYIKSLNDLKIFPGLNKYEFASKFLKLFGINFLPCLEDCSRFISMIATSSLRGSNILPTFIYKYNTDAYETLLKIPEDIFRKI